MSHLPEAKQTFILLTFADQKHFVCPSYPTGQYDFCLRALGRKFPMSTSLKIRFHQILLNFLLLGATFYSLCALFQLTQLLQWRLWWGTATTRGSRTSPTWMSRSTSQTPTSPWTTTSTERSVNLLCAFFVCCHLCYCLILQGSKKNNNMRISQLRKVIPIPSYINSFITLHGPLNSTNMFS